MLALRPSALPRLLQSAARPAVILPTVTGVRHASIKFAPPPPKPLASVPDVPTILKKIGRNTIQHADKFPTWDSFFLTSSEQLSELGIEPARDRRYILRWREKLRAILPAGEEAAKQIREDKRGVKKFGGERRRAQTLFKLRVEERKKERKDA